MLKDRLTLLVVTWQGDELLRNCLVSLVRTFGDDAPPCVVVDNANLASTRDLCAAFPFVTYLAAPANLGFAGGNNLGWPLCQTEYVCLLNNDTVVHADSFSPLVAFMDAHPSVAVAQGTMHLPRCGNTLDDCGTRLRWCGIQEHRHFRRPDPGDLTPVPVFAAKGAMMVVRRAILDRLGGVLFYDHFRSYYEETDFCHRVWLVGAEVWFVPTPPINHLLGATSARFKNAAIWRQYLGNIFFSFLANFGAVGKLRILPPFTVVCFGYLAKCLLTGRFAHAFAALCVPFDLWKRRKSLEEARRRVQSSRTLSDAEFLRRVCARGIG